MSTGFAEGEYDSLLRVVCNTCLDAVKIQYGSRYSDLVNRTDALRVKCAWKEFHRDAHTGGDAGPLNPADFRPPHTTGTLNLQPY
jgi:hypothetical protein